MINITANKGELYQLPGEGRGRKLDEQEVSKKKEA